MAASSDKDNKVFDVSKPGKTTASASSRPLIIGHKNMLKDPMVKEDEVNDMASKADKVSAPTEPEDKPSGNPTAAEAPEQPTTAPTVAKIKIQPLNEGEEVTIKKASKVKIVTDNEPTEEEPTTQDSITEETKEPAEEPEDKPADKEEAKPEEAEQKTEPTTSESATVDAVAVQAESQKKAEKQAKETSDREALVTKLVTEKKYFVPINVASRRRQNLWGIVILVLLILLIGAYVAADAGLINPGFKLPIDLIKN